MGILDKLFKKKTAPISYEVVRPTAIDPKEYIDYSDSKLKGFDMAFAAIKKRNFKEAEEVLKANGYKPTSNHSDYLAYTDFFKHKVAWIESLSLPVEEAKSYLLLYYLYNSLSHKTILDDLEERTGIRIEENQLRQAMRIIRSIDDVISGKNISESLRSGSSGLTTYYVISSMKDGNVCEHCKEMHGVKFMFELAVVGENYPPFNHCKNEFCRCMALTKTE